MLSPITVSIEKFAESHYVDIFAKKYKGHWDVTFEAIKESLVRIDSLLQTSKAIMICEASGVKIIKTAFRLDGSKESAKTSGNRCIVAWHVEDQRVSVLLVYGKTDLAAKNETATWKKLVRENYPEYKDLI
jgi:arabinogalactan endo-1,4-beta-galactosidase